MSVLAGRSEVSLLSPNPWKTLGRRRIVWIRIAHSGTSQHPSVGTISSASWKGSEACGFTGSPGGHTTGPSQADWIESPFCGVVHKTIVGEKAFKQYRLGLIAAASCESVRRSRSYRPHEAGMLFALYNADGKDGDDLIP